MTLLDTGQNIYLVLELVKFVIMFPSSIIDSSLLYNFDCYPVVLAGAIAGTITCSA